MYALERYKFLELMRSKSTCDSKEDRFKFSEWEVELGAPYRVNVPCLMHDIRLRQLDVKKTNN